MRPTTMLRAGALLAGLAVAAGAIGAHALQGHCDALDLERFEKAARYQMYHGLGLLLCAALGQLGYRTRGPALAMLLGTILFSGSLYLLVATQAKWLGHVTPFGGVAFLVGWGWLATAGAIGPRDGHPAAAH